MGRPAACRFEHDDSRGGVRGVDHAAGVAAAHRLLYATSETATIATRSSIFRGDQARQPEWRPSGEATSMTSKRAAPGSATR